MLVSCILAGAGGCSFGRPAWRGLELSCRARTTRGCLPLRSAVVLACIDGVARCYSAPRISPGTDCQTRSYLLRVSLATGAAGAPSDPCTDSLRVRSLAVYYVTDPRPSASQRFKAQAIAHAHKKRNAQDADVACSLCVDQRIRLMKVGWPSCVGADNGRAAAECLFGRLCLCCLR